MEQGGGLIQDIYIKDMYIVYRHLQINFLETRAHKLSFNPRKTTCFLHVEVTMGGGEVVSTPHFCFAIQQNLSSSPIQLIASLKLVCIVCIND